MAEDSFKNIMYAGVTILLFSFLVLWFTISMGSNYSKSVEELQSEGIDLDRINDTLHTAETSANTWKDLFTGQTDWTDFGVIIINGILGIFKTMWNFIITPIDLIVDITFGVLNIPSIVTSIFSFIIIVTIIFGLWRLVKQGD